MRPQVVAQRVAAVEAGAAGGADEAPLLAVRALVLAQVVLAAGRVAALAADVRLLPRVRALVLLEDVAAREARPAGRAAEGPAAVGGAVAVRPLVDPQAAARRERQAAGGAVEAGALLASRVQRWRPIVVIVDEVGEMVEEAISPEPDVALAFLMPVSAVSPSWIRPGCGCSLGGGLPPTCRRHRGAAGRLPGQQAPGVQFELHEAREHQRARLAPVGAH